MPRYTLETIVIILLILWLLGWQAFPVGNLIHLLLRRDLGCRGDQGPARAKSTLTVGKN